MKLKCSKRLQFATFSFGVAEAPGFCAVVARGCPETPAKPDEVGRKLLMAASAELAGISKPLFLQKLAGCSVAAFRLSEEELRQDLANA